MQTLTRTCFVCCSCRFVWCILCYIYVLLCYRINKRHNENCHFITTGSDDWVTWRPALMEPCFDRTPDPDPWRLLLCNWVYNGNKINSIQIKGKTKEVQSCNWVRRNPNKQKPKMKSSGGTWTTRLACYSSIHKPIQAQPNKPYLKNK